jgi:hypothetical protein
MIYFAMTDLSYLRNENRRTVQDLLQTPIKRHVHIHIWCPLRRSVVIEKAHIDHYRLPEEMLQASIVEETI